MLFKMFSFLFWTNFQHTVRQCPRIGKEDKIQLSHYCKFLFYFIFTYLVIKFFFMPLFVLILFFLSNLKKEKEKKFTKYDLSVVLNL